MQFDAKLLRAQECQGVVNARSVRRSRQPGTMLAPIGLYRNDAGTHGIKPGISLSFDFNGYRTFLRLLFWHVRSVWAFSCPTPEPVSRVRESAPVFHWPSAAFN